VLHKATRGYQAMSDQNGSARLIATPRSPATSHIVEKSDEANSQHREFFHYCSGCYLRPRAGLLVLAFVANPLFRVTRIPECGAAIAAYN
jgi:hypothetical protein